VVPGTTDAYTITVSDSGPSDATNVGVNDLLPAGETFVSDMASPGTSYDSLTGVWTIGTLAAGGTDTLTITVSISPSATGAVSNTAVASASDALTVTATDTDTLTPEADLSVTKSVDNPSPVMGNDLTFTIVVENIEPSDAAAVAVNDLLPSGLTYVGYAASTGTYNPTTGVWNIGTLAALGSQTLTLTVQALGSGTIPNIATIGSTTADTNPTNNAASSTLAVIPATGATGGLVPSPPIDLTAHDGQITLNWLPSVSSGGSQVTSYEIFRFTSGTEASLIATVTGVSYVDSNVIPGTTYFYYVEAANSFGVSAPSNIASSTAPAAAPSPGPVPTTGSCNSYSANAAFVCALYEDLLGRAPDAGGLATWLAALSAGQSRSTVALGILSSPEYSSYLISGYYESFLGRPPDPGGLSLFVRQLSAGVTDEQVISEIVGSPEFYVDTAGT